MAESSKTYDPRQIEPYWQRIWQERDAFATRGEGEPFYVLEMFPYPSGDLHMGHVRNYTIGDVFARYQRMQGRDVLHPIGWDALGLPAENQAIKEKIAPQIRTPKNIARMKDQFERLGIAYDWSREIATYQPEYYRWNQWFFVKLFEKGLIYRRKSRVNWCPGCNTVIANEQVREGGICWRGHEGVTLKTIPEWAFRVTAYADEIHACLDTLTDWPERIVKMQREWIGRSLGANVHFRVGDSDHRIEVFTTRLDTIFGCTYVVLAPEHPLALELTTADQRGEVEAFIEKIKKVDRIERTAEGGAKEGVFTGCVARNPFNGQDVPIWIANFVLGDYGTGAVMSVPAHDHRDFEFARKYGLPIRPVVFPVDGSASPEPPKTATTADGVLKDSGPFDGLRSAEAREKMAAYAETEGFGAATVTWHWRDWGFSRQRYWGTPIPIIYCDEHGPVPVPEEQLPVLLPDFDAVELTGEGGAPLGKLPAFYETTCPKCGKPAKREVDTMDTFVDSAWYFARFLSPNDDTAPFDRELARLWLPVDVYVGGPEHAVMHLLYFRFWTKAMRDLGLLDIDEPVKRLITQGMVNATAFRCAEHGYVPAAEILEKPEDKRVCPSCDEPLEVAVEKMSKSKYNGIDPIDLIDRYGADTARLYTLFAAPPQKDLEWNQDGVDGLYRFAGRIFRLATAQADRASQVALPTSMNELEGADAEVRRAVHRTLAKVTEEVGRRNHFNTAIAAMMELVNTLYEHKLHNGGPTSPAVAREAMLTMAQMLAPFAPHLAEQLWHDFGGRGLVAHSRWPKPDAEALARDTVQIAVQVNGKLRGQIDVATDADEPIVLDTARNDANVARHLDGKTIRKEVFVPGRLVNFVVSG